MSGRLVQRFIWDEAGFHFAPDGIYIRDFGVNEKIVDVTEFDEHWMYYASENSGPAIEAAGPKKLGNL